MRFSYVKKIVKIVEQSDIESLDLSFSPLGVRLSGLNVVNRGDSKKTIERVVQVVERKPEPSTTIEKKFTLFHGDCDYIKANYAGTFYWSQDKSMPYSKLKWRQEIREGDVLGYLGHFEELFGPLMTEVLSPCDGHILRTKVKNEQKVARGDKLFLVYVKKPGKNT
jgi:biotin carboxyl carrier protein